MKKLLILLFVIFIFIVSYTLLSGMLTTINSNTNEIGTNKNNLPEYDFVTNREEMVVSQIEARGVTNADVLQAMRSVPRHEFVLNKYLSRAYTDQPLPINHGQTISQPYIVALMSELLEIKAGERVLRLGLAADIRLLYWQK